LEPKLVGDSTPSHRGVVARVTAPLEVIAALNTELDPDSAEAASPSRLPLRFRTTPYSRSVSDNGPPTLGEIIRRQRELNELSMRQFADMVGISNPYLSQIERGLRAPSERVLEAIARSLDLSAEALYEQAGLSSDEEDEEPAARVAIREDPRLTPSQRRALLEAYDAFVATRGRAQPRRRRRG
jgi:transcriptional regulator with XRE-family HTH domain